MEFFRLIDIKSAEENIQHFLSLNNLDKITSRLYNVNVHNKAVSNIDGIWGRFTLNRDEIKGGVRFSLVECPNALCWTITTGYTPKPNSIVIHLTINRQTHTLEFIEEINDVLDDMCINLKSFIH